MLAPLLKEEGTEAQRGKVAGLPSPGGKWPDWDLNSHYLALSPCHGAESPQAARVGRGCSPAWLLESTSQDGEGQSESLQLSREPDDQVTWRGDGNQPPTAGGGWGVWQDLPE